jgi:hypothetical protein
MKNILSCMVIIATQILSMGTASAVVIYDEATDGDLDAIGSTNVNLVAGVNTIQGSINATPPAETDRITFTQTSGLVIDSIILSFSGVWDDFNIGQSMNTALFNNVANLFDDNFNFVTSGASISASFFDSFGPETGPLSTTTDGAIWDFQLSAGIVFPAQPWTLTINTTSTGNVPEPGVLWLLGGGLIGLGFSRKRKAV